MHRFAALAASAAMLSACVSVNIPGEPIPSPPAIAGALQTPITAADGREIGIATFAEGPKGVLIRVNLLPGAIPVGWHGVHLHETGACAPDAFTSAGAHAGHAARTRHGLLNEDGPEAGDLPNFVVPSANLSIAVEMYSPFVTLANGRGRTKLNDDDGAALVIHAAPDDHATQPIGGAGARIACAVIPPAGR